MPIFTLTASAELEGASSVSPAAAATTFLWRVRFACASCREEAATPSVFTASADDATELPNGRGVSHLVQKCKACGEAWSVDAAPVAGAALTPDAPAAVLATFEARGCVPVAWVPGDGWLVRGASEAASWPADFAAGDFCDYDDGAEAPVEVRKLAGVFARK